MARDRSAGAGASSGRGEPPAPLPRPKDRAHRRGMPEDDRRVALWRHGWPVVLLRTVSDWFTRRRIRRRVDEVRRRHRPPDRDDR